MLIDTVCFTNLDQVNNIRNKFSLHKFMKHTVLRKKTENDPKNDLLLFYNNPPFKTPICQNYKSV